MRGSITRRRFLTACSVTVSPIVAGCGREPEQYGKLKVRGQPYRENGTWYMNVYVDHIGDSTSNFHNITVVGYNETGEETFQEHIGDSTGSYSDIQERRTVESDGFPYLVVITADEDDCKDGYTYHAIRWNGTDEQRPKIIERSGVIIWETIELQCDEELPPERLLPDANETASSE